MGEWLAALPWQGWVALLGLLGSALWTPAKALAGHLRAAGKADAEADSKAAETDSERDGRLIEQLLGRIRELDAMVEVHRKALDKNLVRENAVLTGAEVLLTIIEMIEEPTAPQKLMRLRAIEIIELAQRVSGSKSRHAGEGAR